MGPSTRIVQACGLLTVVATLYSIHELTLMSSKHVHDEGGMLSRRGALARGGNAAGVSTITTSALPVLDDASAAQDTQAGVPGLPGHHLRAPPPDVLGQCVRYNNTDMWGQAVNNGAMFRTNTAAECCDACLRTQTRDTTTVQCNVWVWCGDKERCGQQHRECWLKWLAYARVAVPRNATFDGAVGWTSGSAAVFDLSDEVHGWKLLTAQKAALVGDPKEHRRIQESMDPLLLEDTSLEKLKRGVTVPQMYHTVTTVSGAYNQWQTRIHYYHWLKVKRHCVQHWALCEMGGFTRLLHSGEPDNIMDEIPTMVVDPMPRSMMAHDDYVVLNRPYAFVTWVQTAVIPEKYVLMSEPDHLWMRPLPNFMTGNRPAAFNFGYMNPASPDDCPVIRRLSDVKTTPECEAVKPIGNSPTFLAFEDMKVVMPIFLNMSMTVYKDAEAKKLWGWCQEMFAFAMSMHMAGLTEIVMYGHMVSQPPFDADRELVPGRPFYILHYTYGLDFNTTTGKTLMHDVGDWHFDKRAFDPTPIPRKMVEPPDNIDFMLARVMVRMFNEATAAIPCWDEYHSSRGSVITRDCGEKMYDFGTMS